MSYLKYQGKLYKKVDGGFTARQSDIDSKIDVDAQIAELKKEVAELKAHNLELTKALRELCDKATIKGQLDAKPINWDNDLLDSCDKAEEALSSPASRKYLAMIEVVDAAKGYSCGCCKSNPMMTEHSKLCKAVKKLESEEA